MIMNSEIPRFNVLVAVEEKVGEKGGGEEYNGLVEIIFWYVFATNHKLYSPSLAPFLSCL